MCLIIFGINITPEYKFIAAANRDEFYERPTVPMHLWEGEKGILAGKDLKEGGTWMGLNRGGKFAAITNFRDMSKIRDSAPSRGQIVLNYINGNYNDKEFDEYLINKGEEYNGFNLIYGTTDYLKYYSNETGIITELQEGRIYGLSNHLLDTEWHKLILGKEKFREAVAGNKVNKEKLFEMLNDNSRPSDDKLPGTGLSKELERLVSSVFIKSDTYGTRSSTIVLVNKKREVEIREKYYEEGNWKENEFKFTVKSEELDEI
jgi:uncharacterized protein with NRDE domain